MSASSWDTAYNRAVQRGDYNRVAELLRIPVADRESWKPKEPRNPRRRRASRTLDGSPFRAPIALGIALATNPNRGAKSAARLDVTGEREARTIHEAHRDYRPLTVTTPLRDSLGRRSRSRSSYTV